MFLEGDSDRFFHPTSLLYRRDELLTGKWTKRGFHKKCKALKGFLQMQRQSWLKEKVRNKQRILSGRALLNCAYIREHKDL